MPKGPSAQRPKCPRAQNQSQKEKTQKDTKDTKTKKGGKRENAKRLIEKKQHPHHHLRNYETGMA